MVIDGNRQSNSTDAATSVSHEVGHALHPNTHVGFSGLTRSEYVNENTNADLAGEGAATLSNARARTQQTQ
jgi:Zn-dependent membrane protease YugP